MASRTGVAAATSTSSSPAASTVSVSAQGTGTGSGSGTGPAANVPQKPPRILACVLCQHRKIKCDRNFPCANCVKVRSTQGRQRGREAHGHSSPANQLLASEANRLAPPFTGKCYMHSQHPSSGAETQEAESRSPGAPGQVRRTLEGVRLREAPFPFTRQLPLPQARQTRTPARVHRPRGEMEAHRPADRGRRRPALHGVPRPGDGIR